MIRILEYPKPLTLIFIVLIVGLLGLGGWYAYSHSDDTATTPVASQKGTTTKVANTPCKDLASVVVAFKPASNVDRQKAIITEQHATIEKTYDTFNSYLVNVGKGKQQTAITAFQKYPEVLSAMLNGCNTTN